MPPRPGDFQSPLQFVGKFDVEVSVGMIGEGGERNVYNMRFETDTNFCDADDQWVAKENKHIESSEEREIEFHRIALTTQKVRHSYLSYDIHAYHTYHTLSCDTHTYTSRALLAEAPSSYEFTSILLTPRLQSSLPTNSTSTSKPWTSKASRR